MSRNRKMKSNRAKTASDLIKNTAGAARSKPARPRPSPAAIAEEIHELECFIAGAPRISRQQRLARRDILPPLDHGTADRRRSQRMPMQNVIAIKRYKLRLMTELGLVTLCLAGVLGWLHHWLGLNHLLGFFR